MRHSLILDSLWLTQHPNILAFHKAPPEFGGQGALSISIELEDWQMKEEKRRSAKV